MTDNRTRKVNVDTLKVEQLDQIGYEIGKRIGEICDAAAVQVNKITEIYGVKAKIVVQLVNSETGEIIE